MTQRDSGWMSSDGFWPGVCGLSHNLLLSFVFPPFVIFFSPISFNNLCCYLHTKKTQQMLISSSWMLIVESWTLNEDILMMLRQYGHQPSCVPPWGLFLCTYIHYIHTPRPPRTHSLPGALLTGSYTNKKWQRSIFPQSEVSPTSFSQTVRTLEPRCVAGQSLIRWTLARGGGGGGGMN